jgi:hypothetical protein
MISAISYYSYPSTNLVEMPKKDFHLAQICEFHFFCLVVFLWIGKVDCVEVAEGIRWSDRGSIHSYNHWLWTIGLVGNSIVPDVH